jgi:hypothetical protein
MLPPHHISLILGSVAVGAGSPGRAQARCWHDGRRAIRASFPPVLVEVEQVAAGVVEDRVGAAALGPGRGGNRTPAPRW